MEPFIYLDHHATTPTDARVLAAMQPYFCDRFGNAGSAHAFGAEARDAVEHARTSVAALIGARSDEVVFTSGATEANNLALKGIMAASPGRHIVTVVTEHKSVLETSQYLATQGCALTLLGVDGVGRFDLEELVAALRSGRGGRHRTGVLSVMAANNEIGTLHPIRAVARAAGVCGVPVHVDAAQAAGRIPIDVDAWGVACASFSAHKLYGPKGVGALYIRGRSRGGVPLVPQMHGGGQEGGYRSGTLPVSLIVGFGKAAEIARAELAPEAARLTRLRARLLAEFREAMPSCRVNGDPNAMLPGNLHMSFSAEDIDAVRRALAPAAYSATSACSAARDGPSHVLLAIGLGRAAALSSVRLGLGRGTSDAEIEALLAEIRRARPPRRAPARSGGGAFSAKNVN